MAESLLPKRLAWFFTIAFGWTWFFDALFIFGVLQMPDGIGTQNADMSGIAGMTMLLLITPFGSTVAAFVMTALGDGKPGMRALWQRFWNRRMLRT